MKSLILRELPLFSTFFFSSLGFGGMQMARPLFSASFGVSLFLVALVSASSAIARLLGAPLAGWLTDRFGRKPVVMAGLAVRVVSAFLSFYAQSYEMFLILEALGSVGLSVWNTGGNVIVADITGQHNRGRAVALRTASQRLGVLFGPFVGGVLADNFGLRSIFLLNGAGKLMSLLIFLVLIRETRPERPSPVAVAATPAPHAAEPVTSFLSRPFIVLGFVSFVVYLVSAGGAFEALFPIHATNAASLNTVEIGWALSLANLMSFLISFPTGSLADRFGRKTILLPGLLCLGAATFLLAGITGLPSVLLAVAILGIGDGMSTGATLVLAMDMAPRERRGTFLGIWTLIDNLGGVMAPLALGAVAQAMGIPFAFTTVTVFMVLGAIVMAVFGPETRVRRAAGTAAPV